MHIRKYETSGATPAATGLGATIPLKRFAGTIGVALAEAGHHSVVPPRRVGRNMDIRDLAAASVLYLPVEVTGGLLSIGDTHACCTERWRGLWNSDRDEYKDYNNYCSDDGKAIALKPIPKLYKTLIEHDLGSVARNDPNWAYRRFC